MSEVDITREVHEKLAMSLFNATWALLDKEDRTVEDDIEMIHSAHASRYHWGQIGEPLHFERGEWQISRVYSVLGRREPALYHASCAWRYARRIISGISTLHSPTRPWLVLMLWKETGITSKSTATWQRRPARRLMKRETGTTFLAS